MIVTRSSVASLQAKKGLPLGTQVVGWFTLGKFNSIFAVLCIFSLSTQLRLSRYTILNIPFGTGTGPRGFDTSKFLVAMHIYADSKDDVDNVLDIIKHPQQKFRRLSAAQQIALVISICLCYPILLLVGLV
jgi:hypothetical protein